MLDSSHVIMCHQIRWTNIKYHIYSLFIWEAHDCDLLMTFGLCFMTYNFNLTECIRKRNIWAFNDTIKIRHERMSLLLD